MNAFWLMRMIFGGLCCAAALAGYVIVRSGRVDHAGMAIILAASVALLVGSVIAGVLLVLVTPMLRLFSVLEREDVCCASCGYPAPKGSLQGATCPECGGKRWQGRWQRTASRVDHLGIACLLGILLGLMAAEPTVRAYQYIQRLEAEAVLAAERERVEALRRARAATWAEFQEEVRAQAREEIRRMLEADGFAAPPGGSPTIENVDPVSPNPPAPPNP